MLQQRLSVFVLCCVVFVHAFHNLRLGVCCIQGSDDLQLRSIKLFQDNTALVRFTHGPECTRTGAAAAALLRDMFGAKELQLLLDSSPAPYAGTAVVRVLPERFCKARVVGPLHADDARVLASPELQGIVLFLS